MRKLEFSQMIVAAAFILSLLVVVAVLAADFVLLWNGKEAMPQEAVAAITTYGGITASISAAAYAALTAVRSWSYNKHGKGAKDCETDRGGTV